MSLKQSTRASPAAGSSNKPVGPELVRELIARAARAASGGNLQPWPVYALTGAALADLRMPRFPHGAHGAAAAPIAGVMRN